MSNKAVTQFRESIEPFGGIFDQLCLTCVAIKNEEKWVSIYTSLALNSSEDTGTFDSKIIKAGSELVALFVPYSTGAFDAVFQEIESGGLALNVGSESYQIFLNRVAAGVTSQSVNAPNLQFSSVWKPQRQFSPNQETFRPTFVLHTLGDRFYELLPQDDNERISKMLRAHKPRYNGLNGLLQFLGCRNLPNSSSDQALVEVKAVLPFKTTIQEDQVFVDCPESLASKLSVLFFVSVHESITVPYSKHFPIAGRPNWISVPFHMEWPPSASQAEAHVLYNSEELERLTIHHWATAANWRVRVDSYFDPESKLLKEALKGDNQRYKEEKRSEAFEQAIVRLLSLGGLAVTWHGALRLSSKSDLAGYCELPGRRIALIGECTLEKPNAKLSTLRTRAGALLESLGDSAEVLPVVFTACDPVPSDYSDAAKANIALVGRKEIGWLLALVERNAGLSEIIKQIENNKMVNDLPDIARWNDRYS